MATKGLILKSEILNPTEYKKEGHLLLGFNIDIETFLISPVYEKLEDMKFPKPTTKSKKVNFEYLHENNSRSKIPASFRDLLSLTTADKIFFHKRYLVKIMNNYSELLFSPCSVNLGYSHISNTKTKVYQSLKCQGYTPKNSLIAKLPLDGSQGGNEENGDNTTFGVPTPPEH
jgi:hypothetical protein